MKKRWKKKIIACVTALAMTLTVFPQSQLFLRGEKVEAATSEPDITTDLIGYYTFDGSLVNKVSSTGGKATLHGGAGDTWAQPATGVTNYENSKDGFGKAYHFLGDGDTRGEGLQLDAKVTGTDFTISFWVNPEDYGNGYSSLVFANHDDSCFTVNSLNGYRCSAVLGKLWDFDNRGNTIVCLDGDNTENGKASIGKWTMVTITNKNGEQKLYFDGVEKTQGNNTSQNSLVTEALKNQEIFLGINYWDASFKGLMDEVRIYDRALTAEDITELYTYTPSDDSYENRSNQRVTVHDPSIIKVDNKYYIYGTQQGAATTSNLIDWTALDFSQNPTKTMYTDDLETIFTNTSSGYNVDAYFRAYGQPNGQKWEAAGNLWAPDIIYNPDMGKYCMYLSLNGRVWNTAVVLLTSDTIDGPFEYVGPVIFSGFTDGNVATTGDASTNNTNVESARYTNTDLKKVLEKCPSTINNKDSDGDGLPDRYDGKIVNVKGVEDRANTYGTYLPHAIDPAVFYDEAGTLWMTYGSWSGGIYILKLDGKTGLRDYEQSYDLTYSNSSNAGTITSDPYFGKKIAGGFYVSGEGPYIEKIGNYYYLFMSYGFYDPTGGYEMRIFRSENPDGPYVDSNGEKAIYNKYQMNYGPNATTNRGEKLMGNYQWDTMELAEIAQGHNSAFVDDDGRAYVIYHTKFNDGTYGHTVRVHELFLNEDNWLVAAPYEFSGETAVGKTANYTKGSNNKYTMTTADYKKTSWSNDDVAGDYQLLIHKYKVDHAKYEVVKPTNMKLNTDGTITGDVSGSWAWSSKGQPYIAITLDNAVYKGILTNQIIDGTNINTLCFTALNSSSGVNIWGSKIPSDDSIVAYSKHNEKIVIPSTTSKNLTLYTDGMFGAEISWLSSNKDILSDNGEVFSKESDQNVVLTKTIIKGIASYQQDYDILIYGTGEENTGKLMTYNSVQPNNALMPISSLNANTGVSFTFTVTGVKNDWVPIFITENAENVLLSVLNYGGENLLEPAATLSDEATAAGYDSGNAWTIFQNGNYTVTISYNVNGSIEFYRDGKLMLTYAAATAIGKNKVSDLVRAMVNAVKTGGITAKYPMKDLSIGFALDYDSEFDFSNISIPDATGSDLVLPTSYLDYQVEYESNNPSILSSTGIVTKQSKDTEVILTITVKTPEGAIVGTKEHSILVYGTQGDNTKNLAVYNNVSNGMKLMKVNELSDLRKTGVSLTFDIENLDSDQTLLILTDAEEWIRLPILNYDVANVFPTNAILSEKAKELGYTSATAWTIFINQNCKARISYNVDGSISFYKDGDLMLTYSSDTKIGTKTVKDLTKAILRAVRDGELNVKYNIKNLVIGYADDYDINNNPADKYLYYQDYETVAYNSDAVKKIWTSPRGQESFLTIKSDSNDNYGKYLSFSPTGNNGQRSTYNQFNYNGAMPNNYTIELDTQLKIGSNDRETQLAIVGTDRTTTNNISLTEGYILMLSATKGNVWSINNDDTKTVTIPADAWIHIKVAVSEDSKKAKVTILNGNTRLYNGTVDIHSTGTLYGLYAVAGRTTTTICLDNVKVYETPEKKEPITTIGTDNQDGTYSLEWTDYTKYYQQILSENSEVKINFHHYSEGKSNWLNYAVAIAPVGTETAIDGGTGLWHLRADYYSNSTFDAPYKTENVEYISNWNWDDFLSMLRDAEINLTVKREGSNITVRADIIGEDGNSAFYEAKTTKAPATGDLTLYLGGESCYLEIYDVQIFRNINVADYEYGSTITDDISSLAGKTLSYQWYRSTEQITAENASSLLGGILSEASIITGATSKDYQLKADDIGKYLAAIVTITENGKEIKTVAALSDKIQKKKLSIATSVAENKTYDGTVDVNISSITFTGIVGEDKITYDKTAEFTDANAGEEKEVTGTVTLTGNSIDLYVLENDQFTTKATIEKATSTPNLPEESIIISNDIEKVGDVKLPTDWIWSTEDTEKTIPVGGQVEATAKYNGTDKGNYVTEIVKIMIQRETCVHDYSEIVYASNAITISCSKCDSTRKVILETQEGTIGNSYDPKGSAENSILLPTATTITRTGHTLKGWSDTASGGVKYQGEVEYTTLFSAGDTITIYAIWEKIGGPTGTITIAEGKWDSFLTTITFGIYKSKQEEITIDAQAENGIKAVSYLIARDGNSYTEEQLATMDWIAYDSTAKPKLEKNTKNVVYAKLEDQAGNIRYLSSNGIIEDEIAPQITGFDMNVGGLTDHSAELYAEANEDGTYYFVLYKDSEDSLQSKKDSELAEAIIANATKSGAIPAGDRVILSETKLEKATNYNAYIAVRDAAGNASSRVCLFTTAQGMLELTNPTITGFVIYNSDLVADASNTENLKDYSYQWYRSSKPITEDTDFSSLEVIGKAVKGEYTIQREDIGKYLAVTIALEHEVYAGSCKAYLTEPVKPKMVTATATIKDKEYNGTTDAEISELILDGVIPRDQDQVTAIAGDAIFADSKVGNEKEVTVSNVALQGTYASCYQLEQMTIKITGNIVRAGNAPNMPNAAQVWNVSNEITTVGAITLPKDWIWHADDAEKQLIEGVEITAVAVYNGEDKGNYKVESVEIKIQRSTCAHKETEIRNEKAATCTEAGYTGDTYCLSCNQLVLAGNETSALGHSFTDYKENGDATCTEDGTKTATCERCGETKTIVSEGTKKGHTIVIDPAIEPSCTVIGKTEGKHCSACGEVLEAQKGIAALGHDYESKVTKEPTVTETGIRTYTCKRCDHSYTEEIAKLPEETHKHEYTETITKEPTCTVEGVTTFICSCGDQYTEAIKALGHNYEVVIIKPATVTESGIQRKTCKRCEDTYTEEIPKLEEEHKHQYTETITKEPTCTEKGIKTYVCTCGEQYTEDLEALGHDYKSEITKPATETETGIETFTCTRCDDSYTKEIPKLEEEHKHQYTETITKEPTCTEKGVKTFTCSCGDQYTEDLKALGHDYKSEITKPATITETGIETFTCSRCKDEYTKEIPKLEGPQPPNGNTGNTGSSGGTSSPTGSTSSSNNTQTNNNTNNTDNTNTNTTPQEPSENTPNDDKTEDKKVITETKPDGTKVEIVTETKSDGTTIETVTETKTDGSTISTKEIKTEDESASLVTVVETASDGKVTINSVIRTGVSDTSDTVTIAEELLKDVASDERLDSIVVEITDTTVNSATKESKKTVVNVNIPSVEGVAVEKVVLTKDSIEAAKNIGKGLVVNIINGCAKEGTINNYKVTIPAKQLAKIDSAIQEINVEIVAEPVTNVSDASKKNAITKIVNKNKGKGKKTCVVSLATNKEVKAGMNVTIPVTEKTSIAKGSKVYVYRYNAKTGKLIETANCKKTVSGNGTVTIAATSGKDYVISAKKLSGNKVETIKDAISVSVSKKTAKAGKELKMKVSFPNTVSTKLKFGAEKATITYKSSDSKIASVSKAGVITTKRSGTVTIKTTIKLASGQKIVKEQKITIK